MHKKIKFIMAFIFTLLLLAGCSKKQKNSKFDVEPAKPKPGGQITIVYNPDSTVLAGRQDLQAVAYFFGDNLQSVREFPMKKIGGFEKVKINVPDTTIGIMLKFVSGKLEDTNNKKGYIVKLYNISGNVLPDFNAALAVALAGWGRSAGIDPDYEKALELFNNTLSKNLYDKEDYLNSYFTVLKRVKKKDADKFILPELAALEKAGKLDYKTLSILATWYKQTGNNNKYEVYKTKIYDQFPKSEFVQNEIFNNFRSEQNEKKRIDLLNQFVKRFPASKLVNEFYNDLVIFYRNNNEFDKAYEIFKKHKKKIHPFYFQYVAKKMMDTKPREAMEILKNGAERGKEEFEKPDSEKEKTQTLKEWREQNGFYYGMNLYLLGKLEVKQGNLNDAVPNLEKAVALTKNFYPQPELNDLYVKTLFDTGKYKKLLDAAAGLIETGNGSNAIENYVKKAYIKVNGSENGLNDYLAKLKKTAAKDLLSEIKSKMINLDAPEFTLQDLNGKKVSLSDFKGKTVVLDFWATWCGPCKKSFPGMKKAVEFYKNNPDVSFLFVNTWEKVPDKMKNAKDFIVKNNYPFHVLLDTENNVVTKYKVPGIPTKFIIDKNGKIRFKSVGFSGKTDEMVEEIKLMISMLN